MTIQLPICWDKANIGKAISLKAKLDEKQTHYFLACHSPMDHIQDVRAKRLVTERDLYQRIMGSGQRDSQAVVYGAPGTGKSHLIHWLKLRCDYDLATEALKNVVPVLIERRSGSLKDALEQMIDQLGTKFEKYLDPVRKAIERLSEATARQLLANELSVELGPGWTDRGRDPLPRLLRELGQACRAKGFGGWLCRDGGVIDRTIKLLTEASAINEREARPQFEQSDFKIGAQYRGSRENSLEVLELVDELDDSKVLREETAAVANEALRHAVVDMIGLSGANLRKILDVIRKDLQEDGRRLALFVEDVSAMAELDLEVVNALEPQDRQDLCPLTAVLGMTRTGWSHLRENQRDRIEVLACVDGNTTERWSHDRVGLAQFAARYLNATRLEEADVHAIAKHRREHGGDIHISKCTSCLMISECHKLFGKVGINGIDVGLYPLSTDAPFRMLDQIDRDPGGEIAPNQRGLLIHILSPLLSDIEAIRERRFPHDGALRISVSDPLYWTELLQNYCGGWDEGSQRRLLYLSQLWICEASSASEAAQRLLPFLEVCGLPKFSKAAPTVTAEPEASPEPTPLATQKQEKQKADEGAEKKVNHILQNLRLWKDGEDLQGDRELRNLVANMLRRSVPWDSERYPPLAEWKRLVSPPGKAPYDFIKIEGQVAEPATTQFFIEEFPRNAETRELLEALVRFEYMGKRTWDFPMGEHHKRIVERWIRNHKDGVLTSLQPALDLDPPVASAVQFLCLVATVRKRDKLPQSVSSTVSEVFSDCWGQTPPALSKRWADLIADMESRHARVREFVKSELAVVQGRTGGLNFIDPLRVITSASAFQKEPGVKSVPSEYFERFWKTRYIDGLTGGLAPYADLASVLEEERTELKKRVNATMQILANTGYDTSDVRGATVQLCQDLDGLVEARKATRFMLPHPDFDELYRQGAFNEHRQRWAFALEKARKVAESQDLYDILVFDPQAFTDASDALTIVDDYLTVLARELALQEAEVKKGGDPRELERSLLGALGSLGNLAKDEEATSVSC